MSSIKHLSRLMWAYWRANRLRFDDRLQLEHYQEMKLKRHLDWVSANSPFYAAFKGAPLSDWPLMDKPGMMEHFDAMNTAGLTLAEVLQAALKSEQDRDFSPTVRGYTSGLSSGTSGQRGVFVVSDAERAQWAGIVLSKLLPQGIFSGERVAFFLRANSNLYTGVKSRWITFKFFDLFSPFSANQQALAEYQPSILVAPAQVLRALALAAIEDGLHIHPKKVISVAEVLEPRDRKLIAKVFGEPHEVYQATEGFLGCTCRNGMLHLNEEYVHIEPEWLDKEKRRFIPIITDFTRTTQPIIRYRLNDVLIANVKRCQCGLPMMSVTAIEGRCDDMLILPGKSGGRPITVFADVLSRALAQVLPLHSDYRLIQTDAAQLALHATASQTDLAHATTILDGVLSQLGVEVAAIAWSISSCIPAFDPTTKQRRIRREFAQL